jgi:carboxyl-terminal processing protease
MSNKFNKWQPFVYAMILSIGLLLGIFLRPIASVQNFMNGRNKFTELLGIINQSYVDSVDMESLETDAINDLLQGLDPHSVYIPASDLKVANEQLDGNFEGIGVEFNIINDTIMVVTALNGGPAQELGIQPGDRIVKVDTLEVAGNGITNEKVFKMLRGKGGTKVAVSIIRLPNTEPMVFNITRGSIPIYSVEAWRMLNTETGYIKISRFAENTHEEFLKAFDELKKDNVQNLILDLRGNPGGYLSTAIQLVDELLADRKLIVYTEGRSKPRAEYKSEREGVFEKGKVVVLIDEGSASASEIVSGAIQDWDRGMVIGRRSFGKGLVQEPYELSDGSALRLTVSRYYTPSGRCIQKDYSDKIHYDNDILERYANGELESDSKAAILDSTPYYTLKLKRTVYGGGGILPDYLVPIDTSYNSWFLTKVVSEGLIGKFAYEYLDRNRKSITTIPSLKVYNEAYLINEAAYAQFVEFVGTQGIEAPSVEENKRSKEFIKLQIKALIARQIWRDQGYYTVTQKEDKAIKLALKKLDENQALLNSGN